MGGFARFFRPSSWKGEKGLFELWKDSQREPEGEGNEGSRCDRGLWCVIVTHCWSIMAQVMGPITIRFIMVTTEGHNQSWFESFQTEPNQQKAEEKVCSLSPNDQFSEGFVAQTSEGFVTQSNDLRRQISGILGTRLADCDRRDGDTAGHLYCRQQ